MFQVSTLAFAIVPDTTDTLALVASNEKEFNMWTEGIHALLGQEVSVFVKYQQIISY